MPARDQVKTGIGGLDEILSGGIPRGNVILLEGAIGCGKTTMGWNSSTAGSRSSTNRRQPGRGSDRSHWLDAHCVRELGR